LFTIVVKGGKFGLSGAGQYFTHGLTEYVDGVDGAVGGRRGIRRVGSLSWVTVVGR
jgi:hypothetical protein